MHTIFGKAINILVDNQYYTLLRDENLLSPYSLLVKTLFDSKVDLKNQLVYFQQDKVKIGELVEIELQRETVDMSLRGASETETEFSFDVRKLIEFISVYGKPEGLLGVVDRTVSSVWSDKALRVLGDENLGNCAGLVGLGIGFTPSGDDFVCGVLLGLDALGREDEFEDLVSCLDLQRTSLGGRSLLLGALQKEYPLAFRDFVCGVGKGRLDNKIFNFGSTSGTDFVSGFCWVLKKYNERKRR